MAAATFQKLLVSPIMRCTGPMGSTRSTMSACTLKNVRGLMLLALALRRACRNDGYGAINMQGWPNAPLEKNANGHPGADTATKPSHWHARRA
eukprot:2894998-Alexandrium_andersonii.AAC.1